MKRNSLSLVPNCLLVFSRKMDFLKLPAPIVATEYVEGPLSFVTCGFEGMPGSSLRAMLFCPIPSEEWLCHVSLSIRAMSASEEKLDKDYDYQFLSDLLRGTGIRTIDTASSRTFADFYRTNDKDFMKAFRASEGQIRLTENVVVLRAA